MFEILGSHSINKILIYMLSIYVDNKYSIYYSEKMVFIKRHYLL